MGADEKIIVKAKNYDTAYLQSIKETVRMFKEWIAKYDPDKPTCNQELYVRDVGFLLELIDRQAGLKKGGK